MNFIGIVGIIAILVIAWLLSSNRSKVNFRPVIWGLSLQILFALIVLKDNYVSFIGMAILSLLLVTFIMQKEDNLLGGGIKSMLIVGLGAIGLGYLLTFIGGVLLWFMLALLIILVLNSIYRWSAIVSRASGSLLIISAVAFLIFKDYTGHLVMDHLSQKIAYFLSMSDFGASKSRFKMKIFWKM